MNAMTKAVKAVCTAYDFPLTKHMDGGWVAYLGNGPEYCIHLREPFPGKWVARRPRALEHIGIGSDPLEALMMAKKHCDAYAAEVRERCRKRLGSPEVVAALSRS